MAKDTDEQRAVRGKAMSEGYKSAARVPLRTAEMCVETTALCIKAANLGNVAVMSDAGVGALMALAGTQGAIYNVRINLPNTKDETFNKEMSATLDKLLATAKANCEEVQKAVESSLKAAGA